VKSIDIAKDSRPADDCPGARIVKVNYRTILLASVACVSGCSGVATSKAMQLWPSRRVDGPAGLHQQRQYNADGPRPVSADAAVNGSAAGKLQQAPAVLEFQGKNLDQDILMTSPTPSGGACKAFRPRVVVMTRENMLVLLKDMGSKMRRGDCEVETARNIGADYVISGKWCDGTTLRRHAQAARNQGRSLLGADAAEARARSVAGLAA